MINNNSSNSNINKTNQIRSNSFSFPESQLNNDANKYNHLAFFQKQQQLLSAPIMTTPTTQFTNFTFPYPFGTPNMNFANTYKINNSNESYKNLFTENEQKALDDGFMNLFKTDSNSNNHKVNNNLSQNINPVKSEPSKSHNQDKNLIDLESFMDIKKLTAVDLFDPLLNSSSHQNAKHDEPKINYNESKKFSDSIVSVSKQPVIEQKIKLDEKENSIKLREKIKPSELNEKRNSLKVDFQLDQKDVKYSIESFEFIDSNYFYNSEFKSFYQNIENIKQKISQEQIGLILFSPILDYPPSIAKHLNIILNIRFYNNNNDQNKRFQVENLKTSLNATIETIVYNVLVLFDIKDLNISKYLLKIHGLEEYLPLNSTLGEMKYIYECINENKEPKLILSEFESANVELSKNLTIDVDQNWLENKLKTIIKTNINTKLDSLLKSLIHYRNSLEASIKNEENFDSIMNWFLNFKGKIENLKSILNDISYDKLEVIYYNLNIYEKKLKEHLNSRIYKEKEPLMISINSDYNYRIDNASMDHTNLDSFLKHLLDYLNLSLKDILSFVNCESLSFYLPFKINTIIKNVPKQALNSNNIDKQVLEIIQADEKLSIYFKGLSRLNSLFKKLSNMNSSNDLYLKFSIIYGSKCLDSVTLKLGKFEKDSQKRYDYYIRNIKIEFSKLDLCILPRESCLLIQLFYSTSSNSNSNNLTNFNNFKFLDESPIVLRSNSTGGLSPYANLEDTNDNCLAWTSKCLFDDDLILDYKEYFLSMFETDFTPLTSCSASNIFSTKSPVVQISFVNYKYLYKYPNVTYECECQLKDFQKLNVDVREALLNICNKSVVAFSLTNHERDLINEYYKYLNGIPYSLSKIYLSLISYDYSSIIHFYAYLKQCDLLNLAESIELLFSHFPDSELRKHAVKSLEQYSAETISIYLPQLLEALKFDKAHDCELSQMLLRKSSKNIRFAHNLYWQLKEFKSRENDSMVLRYNLLYNSLKLFFNNQMREEISNEVHLVKRLDKIVSKNKELKEADKLFYELDEIQREWPKKNGEYNNASCRLPYNISLCVKEIDIKSCSFISSFTMPLKLVFKNIDSTADSFYTIYKVGDDLRQDMFVLQIISIMNQLWLADDLDLNIILFQCLQTGSRRGFIEMITNAETLKEIQKGDVKNAFKKTCINDWLRFHNPNTIHFNKAVNNFTRSCAAYSVATFLLGIGDRHNDNIMVKYTGHMFHIDFGKYLGDAQTFAGIKRDRSPILFTSDMFYVINQSKQPNYKFQEFIELCCKAFQILRKNYQHILSLFELMTNSGIPGLNSNAIQFVYKNLMIDLNEDDSSNAFKKIIHESLSKFASINFAIHTLAQPKTVNSSNYFSFITHVYNEETDGKIMKVFLETFGNNRLNSETFKCKVLRESQFEPNEVYRTFEEFCELYQLLVKTFPSLKLEETPSFSKFKEAKQLTKRYHLIGTFLKEIFNLKPEISQSDILYTFFHPILRDKNQEVFFFNDNTELSKSNELPTDELLQNDFVNSPDINGQVKLKLRFKDNKFYVNCLQCRNLKPPNNQSISSLKPYVKCYLRPDSNKVTKKKVQALFNGANPIFTETMEYDINYDELKTKTLQLSVLNNKINVKEKIGSIEIRLYDINWDKDYIKWYDLR